MTAGVALLLAVALGAEARVETGVQLEARARRLAPAPTPADRETLVLTASPQLTAAVTGGLGSFSATYNPTFSANDVGPNLRWEHMHQGDALLRLRASPRWSVDAFASGGIGRSDLLTENRNAGTGGGEGGALTGTIPTLSTVDLMRWRSGMTLRLAPDRRTELTLTGALSEDGGTTDRSRTVLPVVRATDASAELLWRATRLDQLGLRASGAQARIADRRADSAWANGMVLWRRSLDPQMQAWLGAGAVVLQSRLPPSPSATGRETKVQYGPAGELGLERTAAQPPAGEGGTAAPPRLEPTGLLVGTVGASVDRITGAATPRGEVRAEIRWPLARWMAVVGNGAASLTWPETGRTRAGRLELGSAFTVGARATVGLGGYGSWQNSDDPSVVDLSEYGAYVRLGLTAPPVTF